MLDCEIRQLTWASMDDYRRFLGKFFWFLEAEGFEEVGAAELKLFAAHLTNGHLRPGGRWGNPKLTKPLSRPSIAFYLKGLRAFYNFLQREELIQENPTAKIKSPPVRLEAKQPLSDETILLLMAAARRSTYARRNEAMLLVLLHGGTTENYAYNDDGLRRRKTVNGTARRSTAPQDGQRHRDGLPVGWHEYSAIARRQWCCASEVSKLPRNHALPDCAEARHHRYRPRYCSAR